MRTFGGGGRTGVAEDWDSMTALAAELVAVARERGVDLPALCGDGPLFTRAGRMVFLWRAAGAIGYNMQGPIRDLPAEFASSASSFYGMWSEAGRLADIGRAFEFVAAWLVAGAEVDQLPERERHRWGIG
jgi:hypothetical protein